MFGLIFVVYGEKFVVVVNVVVFDIEFVVIEVLFIGCECMLYVELEVICVGDEVECVYVVMGLDIIVKFFFILGLIKMFKVVVNI